MLNLTPEEEMLLDAFCAEIAAAPRTRKKYASLLRLARAVTGKPIWEFTVNDVRRWYRRLEQSYRAGTIRSHAFKLRALYAFALRWRLGIDKDEAELRAHRVFSPIPFARLAKRERDEVELRNMILTPEEVDALLRAADHPRLKAMIAVHVETGLRTGELLSLRLRDLRLEGRYATIWVSGKTGERAVPIIRSLPYLMSWLNVHPGRDNPDAPLFAVSGSDGKLRFLTLEGYEKALKRIAKKAGIKRRVYPYMFRHTRLTELAARGMGEFQMKAFAGWTTSSRMAERYIRLGRHVGLRAVLELEGVEEVEKPKAEQVLKTRRCPRCGHENPSDAAYCSCCGLCLREEEALVAAIMRTNLEELLDRLVRRPEVREVLVRALAEMLAKGEVRALNILHGAPAGI